MQICVSGYTIKHKNLNYRALFNNKTRYHSVTVFCKPTEPPLAPSIPPLVQTLAIPSWLLIP